MKSRRTHHDLQLAREIEGFLPAARMLVARLRRDGSVVGQDAEDLSALAGMLETAAARLILRANDGEALDCDGVDPIADAERAWPRG